VPTKIVVKVGVLERDLERDHLAEKSSWTKMGQKMHFEMVKKSLELMLLDATRRDATRRYFTLLYAHSWMNVVN
jgi:hypothetical protein